MRTMRMIPAIAAVTLMQAGTHAGAADMAAEAARQIPVAARADVVVVGGGVGAVSAAVTAAAAGARVFLAAPQFGLGDDMTATLQLWLEDGETPASPLGLALFADPHAATGWPRPLHVKTVLENALLEAGVEFLYGCQPTDVLRDAQGTPAGIVMANRAGRQAVPARVIIDATDRGVAARLAGAEFRSYATGRHVFRRVVIGGEPVKVEAGTVRLIEPPYCTKCRPDKPCPACAGEHTAGVAAPRYRMIEYTLSLDMADGGWRSFAAAEQAARTLTYHPDQQMASDRLVQVPPDTMFGRKSAVDDSTSVNDLPLDAFRPRDLDRFYVLGGAADVGRLRAERLMRPLEQVDIGRRIGEAAAAEAAAAGEPAGARLPAPAAAAAEAVVAPGEVRELLDGPRPSQRACTVPQETRFLPVLGRYDVVVVGGGTGGAPAGIAAAREGARVLMVEIHHMLGGVGTLGQITGYYHGNKVGFTATVPGERGWKQEPKAEWWRRELVDAGADVWFGTVGCGALVHDGRVTGVVVATPHGRGVVLCDAMVDATSNSDIAAPAGAETDYTGSGEFAAMGAGTTYRRLGGKGVNPSFTLIDETDMVDVWHVLVWSKLKYPEAFDQVPLIDTRERRRIVGDFRMRVLDQIVGRTYPDTISQADSDFDCHGFSLDPFLMIGTPPRAQNYLVNIPYRCLLPRGLDGILAAGLGISMHRDAIPFMRMQACVQNLGYAAGLAAATAARAGTPLRQIDIRALQRKLVAIGNLPEEVLRHEDSLPLSAEEVARAVREVPPLRSRHAGGDRRREDVARHFAEAPSREEFRAAAVIFLHPAVSLPLLREAFAAGEGDARFAHAQMLAMLGDATGADALVERVMGAPQWDAGWRYASMSNFGTSMSPLDTAIVALSRTGHPDAVAVITDKAGLLDAASDFSHHRAVALALEQLGDRSAAPALAELLGRPGMKGHVHDTLAAARRHAENDMDDLHAVSTRNASIRELLLARALFRLGDFEGLGASILGAYAADLRGHLARHAQAVLAERALAKP